MSLLNSIKSKLAVFGIAALCFGYFAAYVPYSMGTKMITRGLFEGMGGNGIAGFQMLPIAIFASTLGMFTFLTVAGWWKFATHSKVFGISIPRPQWFTFLSGLCTGGIIITTTLAYTFEGISIVFAMLLMRGGVLVMAPVVDMLSVKRKRTIYWPSWIAAALSVGALLVAFMGKASIAMKYAAVVDISLYLTSYFLRFFIMGNFAKSGDVEEKKRYFTEEQMTANSVLFTCIVVTGLFGATMGSDTVPGMLWYGMSTVPYSGFFWHIFVIGIFSYGTGLFGSLIFLDRREHTFTVPANRSSSIISGVIATFALAFFFGLQFPSTHQLIGVALILGAIFFLSYHSIVEKRRKARKKSEFPEREVDVEYATT